MQSPDQELYVTYENPPNLGAQLGFYKREDIDESGDITVKSTDLSFYSSFGAIIPVGYYSSILIGPEIIFGLSDVSDRDNYIDIFGKETNSERIKLRKYSLKISYVFKF